MPSEEAERLAEMERAHDDGLPWGHITEDGVWHELPKKPLLLAELGPPPFKVRMAWNEMREVVHKPSLI